MPKTLLTLTLLTIAVFLSSNPLTAQNPQPDSTQRASTIASLDVSGGGSLLGLGVDKLVFFEAPWALSVKLGFGYNQEFNLFDSDPPDNYILFPHHVTGLLGKRRSYFEFGVGGSLVTGGDKTIYMLYPVLGYRYHPFRNPGFSFRAWLYYPVNHNLFEMEYLAAPYGLSFGIAF